MKTLFITGGTGALGTVVVKRLEPEYRCIAPSHAEVDLGDETSVRNALASAGEIYGLVHLVGGFATGTVAETSTAGWSNMLALNLTAAFTTIREALPQITRPGRIIAISSVAALDRGKGSAAYTVSKSALGTLIEVVAKENPGICANIIAPPTLTPELRERVAGTIRFLLSEEAAPITGAVIPLRG